MYVCVCARVRNENERSPAAITDQGFRGVRSVCHARPAREARSKMPHWQQTVPLMIEELNRLSDDKIGILGREHTVRYPAIAVVVGPVRYPATGVFVMKRSCL